MYSRAEEFTVYTTVIDYHPIKQAVGLRNNASVLALVAIKRSVTRDHAWIPYRRSRIAWTGSCVVSITKRDPIVYIDLTCEQAFRGMYHAIYVFGTRSRIINNVTSLQPCKRRKRMPEKKIYVSGETYGTFSADSWEISPGGRRICMASLAVAVFSGLSSRAHRFDAKTGFRRANVIVCIISPSQTARCFECIDCLLYDTFVLGASHLRARRSWHESDDPEGYVCDKHP